MNQETEKLIRELADKLGTTAEHLWGVLVKQAPITAVTEIVITIVMWLLLWSGFHLIKRKTEEYIWPEEVWIIHFILAAATGVQTYCSISVVTSALLNPEYWALKQLLS